MLYCQYCSKECKNKNSHTNHERLCKNNPVRGKTLFMNEEFQKNSKENQYTKAKRLGLPAPEYDTTHRKRAGCIVATSEQKSKWAREAKTGGYKENAGRSKKFRVSDSFGNDVVLQSSYELLCSEILNEMNIKWIRPKHLKYDDDKKYFADFYLVDYDIYLDPKNDYKAKLDKEKIQKVIDANNVKIFILAKNDITKEFIKLLMSPNGEGIG
jgi:hypothetical protein